MLEKEIKMKILSLSLVILIMTSAEISFGKDCDSLYYKDKDGDGFVSEGEEGKPISSCKSSNHSYSLGDLAQKRNITDDKVLSELDCDDNDKDITGKTNWYEDMDGDGYSSQYYHTSCKPPSESHKLLEYFISFEVEGKKPEHKGVAYRDCDDTDTKVIHNFMPIDLNWHLEGYRRNK